MTHVIFLKCLIACLIGNLVHVAIRCRTLSKDYPNTFTFALYLKLEKWVFISDLVGSLALVYCADEFLIGDLGSYAQNKIKILFVLIGLSGSWGISKLLDRAKKTFKGMEETYIAANPEAAKKP